MLTLHCAFYITFFSILNPLQNVLFHLYCLLFLTLLFFSVALFKQSVPWSFACNKINTCTLSHTCTQTTACYAQLHPVWGQCFHNIVNHKIKWGSLFLYSVFSLSLAHTHKHTRIISQLWPSLGSF